jgi:endonuclease YncB( thermonuclease family)
VKSWKTVRVAVLVLNLLLASSTTGVRADEISSYAFVQDDGSLRVSGHTVRLFGIYIPPTARSCRSFEHPVTCAPQAALALDFKIGADFVHCIPQTHNDDGSITAVCRAGDTDLSAYLLGRGWALALPDAPFEYAAQEKIARHRGLGVWGLPVEKRH